MNVEQSSGVTNETIIKTNALLECQSDGIKKHEFDANNFSLLPEF